MSWLELWLIALVTTGSRGCLKCSQEGMAMVKDFRDNYLYKKLRRDSGLRTKLQKFMEDEIEQLPHYFLDKGTFKGIIDEFSLETLVAHFRRSLNQIKENEFEGEQLFNEVVWSVQNLQATFEKMLPSIQKIYCSNECGHMIYVLYSCFSCQINYYSCSKNFHCGERNIEVETDEDLILDCALTWHKASHGVKRYSFFRVLGNTEKLMTTGLDSFLVKKEANTSDTGRYRCKMLGAEGHTASQLDFRVEVVPAAGRTTWFRRPGLTTLDGPLTLGVSSRAPPPQEDWTAWIVIGVTGSLLLIFIGGFLYFYLRENKEEEEEEGVGSESETKSELVET
ncbi:izumo sperm-egg fusion protein 1 [Tiliqua scincoides]|uniref:izumo sperm-egg fusion protein 1 n=1 Tax=Tiliqua scincoides TaxID=71010 RepID=UPI0034633E5E